ncbi:uncharacterized protein LOC123305659 isoform X2 [Chrysoperla carnea]|uniref:uncharacterized protein LOC123305659 isoform X2 n=1 Tax=Chrysoperla carnea TaxID=189513 RepID=UPI001D075CC1|nr:uncharacterized protein LOC123305659 isoform X2 [Chrysoperla carnea]
MTWPENYYLLFFKLFVLISKINCDQLWQQDLSKDITIGAATSGYDKVQLRCGANSMQVDITLSDNNGDSTQGRESVNDFQGVIYTRGSFHRKQAPCYLDPDDPSTIRSNNGRSFTLKFPLNKCQTLHNGDIYSNVIVVQYDKDLIMPGDAAFNVECDFSKPRDITVNADLNANENGVNRKAVASRITLTDADPAASTADHRYKRAISESDTDFVEFTPAHVLSYKI